MVWLAFIATYRNILLLRHRHLHRYPWSSWYVFEVFLIHDNIGWVQLFRLSVGQGIKTFLFSGQEYLNNIFTDNYSMEKVFLKTPSWGFIYDFYLISPSNTRMGCVGRMKKVRIVCIPPTLRTRVRFPTSCLHRKKTKRSIKNKRKPRAEDA